MIGIVESGSTKTQWLFFNKNKKQYAYRTSGFNPYYQTKEEISHILQQDLIPILSFDEPIRKIYYYGAGCEAAANKMLIQEAFQHVMSEATIYVHHDLLAAAKALFGDTPGIACISGTGSNTCVYDGSHITENIQSLGLYLGDEGSGGYKGKLLMQKYIRKALPIHLINAFEDEYPDRTDYILDKIYRGEMPSRYLASFTPFLVKHIDEPAIHALIYQSFDDLFKNCILRYTHYSQYPIGFVGSVAYHFQNILKEVAESKKLEIALVDPDPYVALTNYHIQRESTL